MDEEYAEYRCSACRKAIKSKVVRCKTCPKLFYHPGCVNKHRIYDRNQEYVPCKGPFEEFLTDIEKAPTPTGRDRTSSTGSVGMSSGSKGSGIDLKIDWIIKAVKEIKDEAVRKNEIKTMIKEVVQEELENVKQEIETLKKMIHGSKEGPQRSYSEAVKEKKKENVIIVKPKLQQESEDTKKVIKEKVDIKNMAMGVTKLKKGSKGVVIMGCESGEEVKKLKETVQAKLGENYKVLESSRSKPKVKIVNINLEEMNLDDNELINTIKKQNRIDTVNMRIVKRMVNNQRRGNEGSVIMEIDEETHELILKKSKLNIGWKKCPIFNHISVKRCFKCWGYFHIAKNCTREETCCKCAGNHSSRVCTATESKCVNCMFKNRTYNLKINDEHEAISRECPTFKRALQEEKRRAGCEDTK
ncbi:uncharacterized protein LOC120359509 [Solenopsis invicta]|uniref:uncharacterized protein LOC120359509 n=1 Tax=Solenopsis invicta TaxID=13686 RepID=UPI00193D18BA|nr:uncharacterized protein LOC120359509 [Solenopsis invicta]